MKELRNCNEIVKMDSRTVEGYALVFGKQSRDLGGFTEVIEPTALEGILEKSDILCLLNHNEYRGILSKDILLNNNLRELLTFIGEKGLKAIDKVFPNKEKVLKDLESSKEYIGSNVRRIYMKALKK